MKTLSATLRLQIPMLGQNINIRPLDGLYLDYDAMEEIYPIAREHGTSLHVAWTPFGAEVSAHVDEKDPTPVLALVEKMSELLFGSPGKLAVSLDVEMAGFLILRRLDDLDQWVKEQVGGLPVSGYHIEDIVVEGPWTAYAPIRVEFADEVDDDDDDDDDD